MTATLTVDLEAFDRNIATVRGRVAPAEVMLVVKNDAYGHGLDAIVDRALSRGIRWFGAFDVATGLRVRDRAGESARIFSWLVFGRGDAADAVNAGLDIGVGDADTLEEVAAAATDRPARVHLKIDTGLHRNGIRPESWDAVLDRAAELATRRAIEVVGVWSHIAEASDADDDAARALYEAALRRAESVLGTLPLRHLAASAASFARADFRYDLVRVGAFCYGIRPAGGPSDADLGIEPIASLDAGVVSVSGSEVRVDIGSADGIPSILAGAIEVSTPDGPRRVRAIGATCMMIDAWPRATAGQAVRIYGRDAASATDLAEAVDTIGEEIAVRISPLIERVYA
ncbi:alanine racemase [Microbacterium sp. RD1]|uniref:alanine racemase n=1 Tax=Microbacterium sp. RD1 TaxID=3457313 RepID=UPI003FA58E5D